MINLSHFRFVFIILSLVFTFFLWWGTEGAYAESDVYIAAFFSFFVVFGLYLIESLKSNKDYFSADLFFVLVFSLFHFSYVWIYALGLVERDYEVFYVPDLVAPAVYLSLLCMIFFLVGFGVVGGDRIQTQSILEEKYRTINRLAAVFLLLSLLFFWGPILSLGMSVFYDYKKLIDVGSSKFGKIYWVGQYIGAASLAVYFSTLKQAGYNNFFKATFVWVAVLYSLSYLIIGDRGGFLASIIIPVVAYNFSYNKISGKFLLMSFFLALFLSNVIAMSRTTAVGNVLKMGEAYLDNNNTNPLSDALVEFGSSLKTVVISMHYIPNQYDYWYGKSYVDSAFIIFPNFIGKRQSESVAVWLTETAFGPLDKTWGRGGSIVMEAYANWGVLGAPVVFLLLGFVFKRVYIFSIKNVSPFYFSIYLAFCSAFALWVRNTSAMAFRTIVWTAFFYLLLLVARDVLNKTRRAI